MSKIVWIDLTTKEPWNSKKSKITTGLESGFSTFILNPGEESKAKVLGTMKVAEKYQEDINLKDVDIVILEGENVGKAESLKKEGKEVAVTYVIKSGADLKNVEEAEEVADYVIVNALDWKIIPLENLIADFQKKPAKLLAVVTNTQDAAVFLETLEKGVDGVVYEKPKEEDLRNLSEVLKKAETIKIKLEAAKIIKIQPVGVGDRVCVDTCSMLTIGEGMLVGSQSNGLFLVHSETLESDYVSSRPFRVNAGPVHSYIAVPGDKTKYLSELKAGDEVIIVNSKGEARSVVIGRVKIERRPLLLIEVEKDGEVYKILLQNAETIRLVDKSGKPVSVSKLKVGDEVLVHIKEGGRHFGTKVDETIIER
ncbi:MAG: 3-dehydroquinate synthase II [Candidatus Odinarchaeia archaeon]